MTCADVRPYLAAGEDELDPVHAALLAGHLDVCSSCRDEVAEYRRLARALSAMAWTEVEGPADLLERSRFEVRLRPWPLGAAAEVRVAAVAAGSAGAVVAVAAAFGVLSRRRRITRISEVPVLRVRPRAPKVPLPVGR